MSKRTTTLDLALPPRTDDGPAYRWLCTALRTQILEGRLRPGARLPALSAVAYRAPGQGTGWSAAPGDRQECGLPVEQVMELSATSWAWLVGHVRGGCGS